MTALVRIVSDGDGSLVRIVLDRPEALNAISTALAQQVSAACARLAELTVARAPVAVILTGAGARAFCAGADLRERAGFTDDQWLEQRPVLDAAFAAVRNLPMAVIAAVEGFALGGGCELALSADLIVAGETAVFGLPEVAVGLVPGGGGTQLLPRRVGAGRAADLILTGRRVEAAEAYQIGLVDRLVPAGQALAAAEEIAGQIALRSPLSVRAAKHALRHGADRPLAEALAVEAAAWRDAAFSVDRPAGIAAFATRETPRWPSRQAGPIR